jgi:FkbM family methyltransferase
MKLRNLVHLLGWQPPARTWGHEIRAFDLPRDGRVEYAQWLHPGEREKTLRQDVVDHLRTFLRPGDVAIDIGAHTGDSTLPIALAVGPSGRVFALEPNPHVFAVLERNAALNRDRTAIVPLNFAATPEAGTFDFSYSDAGYCNGGLHAGISRWRHGHAFTLKVRGERLDRYLAAHHPDTAGRIRFVKTDAEGCDLAILESIASLIDRERPCVRAEVYKLTTRAERERLLRFFLDRGYEVRRVEHEANYRGDRLGVSDAARWRHYDIFCTPAGPRRQNL